MMNHIEAIATELEVDPAQVAAAVQLLDDGNTLPFIARYRKEATGGLDEEQLRKLNASLEQRRALDKRRQTIIETIAGQDQLTAQLKEQLLAAQTQTELEDLYQPYKPKRRTRASVARERGLSQLAEVIVAQEPGNRTPRDLAIPFLSDEVPTVEEALSGARDIVAELISDNTRVRQQTREKGMRWGTLRCERIEGSDDERGVFSLYYEYQVPLTRIRPHQVLAINRGEAEKILRVKIEVPERDWRQAVNSVFRVNRRSPMAEQMTLAIDDAAGRLLLPAIQRDIRRLLTESAEHQAISVFADNLRNLLLQPPLPGYVVLAIDPGYRTGCKIAVVETTSKVLDTETIFPHSSRRQRIHSIQTLKSLITRHGVSLIAIGNGTASRETEQVVVELIKEVDTGSGAKAPAREQQPSEEGLQYLIVNEAGASVYSASPLARSELPDLDVTLRGAVSIARRVQDPLAELVKIDPKAIGVGMYQHDVNQGDLATALNSVVESVVNYVGVDVNTASPALLTYVAGIGPKLAENIVTHRDENGRFLERKDLLAVAGLGPKSFEQAAGFLRIQDGRNPLDASAIHPESYEVARSVLRRAGLQITASQNEREERLSRWHDGTSAEVLANELGVGPLTMLDILEQLVRPGRDPRTDLPKPILRRDVMEMADLRPGMRLMGTVRNVVDFGAFVDIGVKQDGLLHRSQWPPNLSFGVGDVVEIVILSVDPDRGRISLGWSD